jgi:hypothetical protein
MLSENLEEEKWPAVRRVLLPRLGNSIAAPDRPARRLTQDTRVAMIPLVLNGNGWG